MRACRARVRGSDPASRRQGSEGKTPRQEPVAAPILSAVSKSKPFAFGLREPYRLVNVASVCHSHVSNAERQLRQRSECPIRVGRFGEFRTEYISPHSDGITVLSKVEGPTMNGRPHPLMSGRPTRSALTTVTLAGERVELFAERALYWPRGRTLFVADVHLGKAAAFRAGGVPLPGGTTAGDLARLARLIAATRAERLVVLGGFLHAAAGRTDAPARAVSAWRRRHRAAAPAA